jgi:hypothetical protein
MTHAAAGSHPLITKFQFHAAVQREILLLLLYILIIIRSKTAAVISHFKEYIIIISPQALEC